MTNPFFLLLFVIFLNTLSADIVENRKFNVVISLGEVCQSAGNIRANHLSVESFPFDWLITPFEGLMKFMSKKGDDFLNKNQLLFNVNIFGQPKVILDTYYHIYSLHDFTYFSKQPNSFFPLTIDKVHLRNYEEVQAKFQRRIKRLFHVLRSDKKIMFLRLGITYEQAIRLDQFFQTHYPQLDYLLVVLDNTEEMKSDWELERIKNFYIERSNMFESNPEEWKKIFDQFEFQIEKSDESAS